MNLTTSNVLTPRDLAIAMGEYESTHAVEQYSMQGWDIWPFLRNNISRGAINASLGRANTSGVHARPAPSLKARIRTFLGKIARPVRAAAEIDLSPADVVVFGTGDRFQTVDGEDYQFITDPIADELETKGVRCQRWAIGPVRDRCKNNIQFVDSAMHETAMRMYREHPVKTVGEPADWFEDVIQLQGQFNTTAWGWRRLNEVTHMLYLKSVVMEAWLRQIEAKVLLLDCWYGWDMYAATLAAHRTGIRVLDIQHGIQENTHFGFHHWTRAPRGGFGAVPDGFWVWGEKAASIHRETNSIGTEVITGGNAWVRAWTQHPTGAMESAVTSIKAELSGYARKILVTTSKPAAMDLPYLKSLIDACPDDWAWLIRVHPMLPQDRVEAREVLCHGKCEGDSNVFIELGCESPLYALFRSVDWHVSHDSTCATEAMCFDVPTALIGAAGLKVFGEYIDGGIMIYDDDPLSLAAQLQGEPSIDCSRLHSEATDIFGHTDPVPALVIDRLMQAVG